MRTNYSRRDLYAMGEPIGDSSTKVTVGKHRIYGSGGGSAPSQPTTTTVQNTNLPTYAQPYVTNMLGAAQSQIFQGSTDANGNFVPTGFNAFTPFGTQTATGTAGLSPSALNAAQSAVAGFSPLQQQAQSEAAGLQVPGQFNPATGLAMQSGYGSLGAVPQSQMLGAQSQGYGALGAATGQNLAAESTNPAAVQAYMNPYLQASLAPQLQLLNQQYGIAGQQEQGAATQTGGFGGSREALMNSLNQQNQMLAQNQLVGNAYNTAFTNAQNQMNTATQAGMQGAGLGLQGISNAIGAGQYGLAGLGQAGWQAANLANIGGQQLAAQQGVIGTQAQQGAAQQTQQQNVLNQAIQNYATQQQYPMLQLANMSNLLHGLPMQSATTSSYQAAPTGVAALGGLGTAGIAGLGLYNATSGSDPRLKENIKLLFPLDNGLNLYAFEYKSEFKSHPLCGEGVRIGFMADEVEELYPEAVFTMDNGYKGVNYKMLAGEGAL